MTAENIRKYAGISDDCKLLHKEAGLSWITTDANDVRGKWAAASGSIQRDATIFLR